MEDELVALQNEIRSLQADIEPLETELQGLQRQVAQFETQNKIVSVHLKPTFPKEVPIADDHEEAPPVIHDEYFDESIRKYFKERPLTTQSRVAVKPTLTILANIEQRTVGRAVLLVENVRRFGGVTAFPLNDRLYDSEDCTLLGLRFDVLDHGTGRFREPCYIILRRKRYLEDTVADENLQWLIFRYTTPAYVSLDKLSKHLAQSAGETSLLCFAEAVRRRLVLVQYKHNLFDQLARLTHKDVFDDEKSEPIALIEKNSDCSLVVIHLQNHKIELTCEEANVIDVKCISLPLHETLIRSLIVYSEFANLPQSFIGVCVHLRSNNII